MPEASQLGRHSCSMSGNLRNLLRSRSTSALTCDNHHCVCRAIAVQLCLGSLSGSSACLQIWGMESERIVRLVASSGCVLTQLHTFMF